MKSALIAMVCTLGAVACGGQNRPAEDATMTRTETTTTTASEPNRNPAITSTPSTATPNTTMPSPTGSTDGLDTSRTPRDERTMGANPSVAPGAAATPPAVAPSTDNAGSADRTKDATNTKTNDRDRHGALTPMDQGGGSDRDITANIRRAVVGDKALSFNAKNVKIITVGGKVTLRGPVKSDEEKANIEAKAKQAPGVTSVDNQLEVKK